MSGETVVPEVHTPADWGSPAIISVKKEEGEKLGMTLRKDLVVKAVTEGSPAARTGVMTGMLIVAVNGKPVNTTKEIQQAIGGAGLEFSLTAKKYTKGAAPVTGPDGVSAPVDSGDGTYEMTLTADRLKMIALQLGPLMEIRGSGTRLPKGLRCGSTILQVNGRIPATPNEALDAISSSKTDVLLKLKEPKKPPGKANQPTSGTYESTEGGKDGKGGKGGKDGKDGKGNWGGKGGYKGGFKGGYKGGFKGGKGARYSPYPEREHQSHGGSYEGHGSNPGPSRYGQHAPAAPYGGGVNRSPFLDAAEGRFGAHVSRAFAMYDDNDFRSWCTKGMHDVVEELRVMGVDERIAAPLQNLAKSHYRQEAPQHHHHHHHHQPQPSVQYDQQGYPPHAAPPGYGHPPQPVHHEYPPHAHHHHHHQYQQQPQHHHHHHQHQQPQHHHQQQAPQQSTSQNPYDYPPQQQQQPAHSYPAQQQAQPAQGAAPAGREEFGTDVSDMNMDGYLAKYANAR